MINKSEWYWCGLCECASIKCNYCEGSLCNGMGCNYCREKFEEADKVQYKPFLHKRIFCRIKWFFKKRWRMLQRKYHILNFELFNSNKDNFV